MGFSGSAPEKQPEKKATPVKASAPTARAADNKDIIAVIAAAVAACDGGDQLAFIGRLGSCSGWTEYSRIESVTIRNQMF